MSGVTVVQTDGSRWLLEVAPGSNDQVALRAALATGPVREFRRDVPSLSELFRHLVTEESQA